MLNNNLNFNIISMNVYARYIGLNPPFDGQSKNKDPGTKILDLGLEKQIQTYVDQMALNTKKAKQIISEARARTRIE